jgi:NAD(P)-dependent dehydrogenase (short-subunit alcohol dehydrogenase family)
MSPHPVFERGKTALITGGASGIGLALASKCARYGMRVVIVDNNGSNLSSAKSSIRGDVATVEMDVSKVEDFEKLKSKVAKEFGGVFLLVLSLPNLSTSNVYYSTRRIQLRIITNIATRED